MSERAESAGVVRAIGAVLVCVALVGGAMLADRWAYETLVNLSAEKRDWAKMLRVCGYWPTWLVIGVALVMVDWPVAKGVWPRTDRWARGALLAVSSAMGGLLAEGVKLLVRRERPDEHEGAYVFRAFAHEPWRTSGLGFPSSHAAVAFAAAWMLTRLHPRAWVVWMGLAVGCGLTRVLDQAHFLSDVAGGAVVGIGAAEAVWRLHAWNHRKREARA